MWMLRAWTSLVLSSFRRHLRSKKVLLCLLFLAGLLLVIAGIGTLREWTPSSFGRHVVLRLYCLFFLPTVCLLFGTAALGDELEERTLPYLLARPLPGWAIFVGKLVAVLPIVLALTLGGIWLFHGVAAVYGSPRMSGILSAFVPAALLGTLAYVAVFHSLGATLRHSTMVAIAYVFFIEVFVGRVPGILKRLSVSFYTWSIVYDSGRPLGIEPTSRSIFLPISGSSACVVLVVLASLCVVVGAILFSRSEKGLKND